MNVTVVEETTDRVLVSPREENTMWEGISIVENLQTTEDWLLVVKKVKSNNGLAIFFFASILYDSCSSDTYLGSPAKLICTGLILWWTMYGYIYNKIIQKKKSRKNSNLRSKLKRDLKKNKHANLWRQTHSTVKPAYNSHPRNLRNWLLSTRSLQILTGHVLMI